jgi:hypothetical protein
MEDKNRDQNKAPGKSHGMQGIDKAPGEETAGAPDEFISQSQKGKNSVDGDPSKESDQPIRQQDDLNLK